MSESDLPLRPGDELALVQLSPCVGGLIRTWAEDGESRLWSVPSDSWLRSVQGTGKIARTVREQRRFREAGLLGSRADGAGRGSDSDGATLLLQARFPLPSTDGRGATMEAQVVELAPGRRPSRATFEDFRETLTRAVQHCVATDEFLIVERGGWDAPNEPFCLSAVLPEGDGAVSVVETAPAPTGSELWEPFLDPANASHTMAAPASPDTIGAVPTLMIEAISRWGLDPWDLALTFGQR